MLTLRLNDLKKGTYYVFYRPDFKDEHIIRRINVVFYSKFMQKRTPEELEVMRKMQKTISEPSISMNPSALSEVKSKSASGLAGNKSKSRKSGLDLAMYDESKAIEFERLEPTSFSDSLFSTLA